MTPAATAATPTVDELRLPGTAVQFTPTASAQTKALAAQHKAVVSAAATECGAGYKPDVAERLPDSRRYGTLFNYTKTNSQVFSGACAIFENDMPGGMKMKLKPCPNRVWDGIAGPAIIDVVRSATPCD